MAKFKSQVIQNVLLILNCAKLNRGTSSRSNDIIRFLLICLLPPQNPELMLKSQIYCHVTGIDQFVYFWPGYEVLT